MDLLELLTGTWAAYRNMRQLHHQQSPIPTWVTTAWVIWVADFTEQFTLACLTTPRCFITGVLPLVILPFLYSLELPKTTYRQEVWNSGLWCSYLLLRVNVNNPIIIIINLAINMLFCLFYYYDCGVKVFYRSSQQSRLYDGDNHCCTWRKQLYPLLYCLVA